MDLSKLKHIIEIHRPSQLISSLPFAVDAYEGLNVRWFVYEHEKNDGGNIIKIQRIFTIDRSGRVEIELNPGLIFKTRNIVTNSDICEDESITTNSQWPLTTTIKLASSFFLKELRAKKLYEYIIK